MNTEFKIAVSIDNFEPWAGAIETWNTIENEGKTEEFLEALANSGEEFPIDEMKLNDILWFDSEWALELVGLHEIQQTYTAAEIWKAYVEQNIGEEESGGYEYTFDEDNDSALSVYAPGEKTPEDILSADDCAALVSAYSNGETMRNDKGEIVLGVW